MTEQQLRVFCGLAEAESFSALSKKTGQPASELSAVVTSLEQELSATLVNRQGTRLWFTPAGEKLLEYGRQMLSLYDTALEEVGRLSRLIGLRVLTDDFTAGSLLPSALKLLAERDDSVKVSVSTGRPEFFSRRLLEEEADLAVSYRWFGRTDSRLHYYGITKEPAFLCCGREHPLASSQIVTPDRLAGCRFVLTGADSPYMHMVKQLAEQGHFTPDTGIYVSDPAVIFKYVQQEHMLTILPQSLLKPYLKAGTLSRIKAETEPFMIEIVAAARAGDVLSASQVAFLQAVHDAWPTK